MKDQLIERAYEIAKERYNAVGVDVEQVLKNIQKLSISLHCWQADDVVGFEKISSMGGGGFQPPETHPGRPPNITDYRPVFVGV